MAVRPYAQKSVFDLEAIFERSRDNASELERLSTELTFRTTGKARSLATKVGQSLDVLNNTRIVSLPAARLQPGNPVWYRIRRPGFQRAM